MQMVHVLIYNISDLSPRYKRKHACIRTTDARPVLWLLFNQLVEADIRNVNNYIPAVPYPSNVHLYMYVQHVYVYGYMNDRRT